ncbi:Asp23/Gls24 family envelope stress response protein [Streptomyces sp. SID13726]|uniref:Asp23/Gls24 family envelope stress response protein n=1 Tax=Streptomyces sp. SID13726 TaxID=2706058 RepID=UPI0013BA38D5|nr:Asp23/Gls24 family envelope stress response protein [Streptomyces sp. SID13726]NEB05080.1 Asp23/Gls24 family envelope stress response protein [Streptomyces sp. SID13726]
MTAHTDPPNRPFDHGDDELLPCGRPLSQTWDAWERRDEDPHLRSCPHCRDAVHGLDELESAARRLHRRTADGSTHDIESLTRRVMDVVRLELRPGRPLPLGEPTEDLWIMEAVAARAVRAAAETVPGVRAGSCRLLSAGADAADGADGPVGVRLDIHAPAGVPLPDIAAQVRERVWAVADRELGMAIAVVDIRVTDVVSAPADDEQEGRTP